MINIRLGRHWHRQAFTLVELVVVLLIMGIMAATAAPRYRAAVAHHQITSAARQLQGDLQFARDEALRTSSTMRVEFDSVANRYSLPGVADPNRPGATYAVALAPDSGGVDLVAGDFADDSFIDFNLHGIPHAAGQVRLQLSNLQFSVDVDAAGHATIGVW